MKPVTSNPEHKSPYKHRPYTNNNKVRNPGVYSVGVGNAFLASFDIFDNRTQKIHDEYLAAAVSGDSAESARLAKVYREHLKSIHEPNLWTPVLDLPEEEEPRSESVDELENDDNIYS